VGLILGIETSCDETAAALLDAHDGSRKGACVRSQVDLHARFGGVVPEVAGRSHVEDLLPVLEETFAQAGARSEDVEAVAVTQCPGLIGSLLVGVSAAKARACALRVPLVAVNHVEAHVYSCFQDLAAEQLSWPAAVLVASGGHSSLYEAHGLTDFRLRGETVDDAPGEAFDKVAALLGLPYPGGPSIDRQSEGGDPKRFRFPRANLKKRPLDFSFSGLKTAVLYHCRGFQGREPRELDAQEVHDVAASFQEAVVDALLGKLVKLARLTQARMLGIGGGVAANRRLRARAQETAEKEGLPLWLAPRRLTTDNAEMIAGLGRLLWRQGRTAALDLDASPTGSRRTPLTP